MASSGQDLRLRLRAVFDRFDVDNSGSVSTDEMRAVCEQMDVKLTPAQLGAMMAEADPDRSGAVDFEEFVAVLTKQMESGGQLATVVTTAGGFFGLFNPLSWFSAREASEATARKEPTPRKGWLPRYMKPHQAHRAASARPGSSTAISPRPAGGGRPLVMQPPHLSFAPIYRGSFRELQGGTSSVASPRFASPRFSSLKAQRVIHAGEEHAEEQRLADEAEAEERAKDALRHKLGLPPDAHVAIGPDGRVLMEGDGFAQPTPLSEEEAAERAAARAAMEASITDEERARYRQIFDKFDRDGSGAVSTDEMTMMLRELGISKSIVEVNQIMIDADPDGSGEIDFTEFIVVMRNQREGSGGLGDVAKSASDFFSFSWLGGGGGGSR
jgi:Ca2+-binding EF-hand superfamily protein